MSNIFRVALRVLEGIVDGIDDERRLKVSHMNSDSGVPTIDMSILESNLYRIMNFLISEFDFGDYENSHSRRYTILNILLKESEKNISKRLHDYYIKLHMCYTLAFVKAEELSIVSNINDQMDYFQMIYRLLNFIKCCMTGPNEITKSSRISMEHKSNWDCNYNENDDISYLSRKLELDLFNFPERISSALVSCYSKIIGKVNNVDFISIVSNSLVLVLNLFPRPLNRLNEAETRLVNNILVVAQIPSFTEEGIYDRLDIVLRSLSCKCPEEIESIVRSALDDTKDNNGHNVSLFRNLCCDVISHCSLMTELSKSTRVK